MLAVILKDEHIMRKLIKILLALFMTTFAVSSFAIEKNQAFAATDGCRFIINGKTYSFIGANFWYGAILGSEGEGGNRDRLIKELDFLKSAGVDNLRVMIGADGFSGVPTKVEPTLQLKPGVYNDTIFDGLDFLLSEMRKREMYAVLFFTNSWEWSGGYGQYLNWAGKGKNPIPNIDGWPDYIDYVKQYADCDKCHKMLKNHIKVVLSRTNRYTGVKYTEDPTIFSWEIGNEPRAFSDENKKAFTKWLKQTSKYIKSLDKNHMVTIGTEGKHGCEEDIELFEITHADKNIDYLCMHIWPKNWSWLDIKNIKGSLQTAIDSTNEYIKEHEAVAKKLNKPVVLEEFGFPRDNHLYSLDDPTTARDIYYANAFKKITDSVNEKRPLAGCNIWAWGGFGRPSGKDIFWKKGDDYLGDPAQEEQGLNTVFDTDETVNVIRKYTKILSGKPVLADLEATDKTVILYNNIKKNLSKGIMIGHQDDAAYGHSWYGGKGRSDVLETTGDYPAVYGWELGHLEIGAEYNLDSIYFTDMKRLIREIHDRSAINTISWHSDNPCTGKTAWDCAQDTVVKSVLPGGIKHDLYLNYLDKLADFFLSLKDKNGEYIPVIFRIFHEHTGSWFWWGAKQCTPQEYISLYRFTVSYLRDIKNVHNILWAYSPADVKSEQEYLERYPGDEYVDIIGFDTYTGKNTPESIKDYMSKVRTNLDIVTSVANKYDKIPILAETGNESISMPGYFTKVLYPVIKDYKISYVLFWRNASRSDMKHHFYVPYAGHPEADDFKAFTDYDDILLNRDVKNIYNDNF